MSAISGFGKLFAGLSSLGFSQAVCKVQFCNSLFRQDLPSWRSKELPAYGGAEDRVEEREHCQGLMGHYEGGPQDLRNVGRGHPSSYGMWRDVQSQ